MQGCIGVVGNADGSEGESRSGLSCWHIVSRGVEETGNCFVWGASEIRCVSNSMALTQTPLKVLVRHKNAPAALLV